LFLLNFSDCSLKQIGQIKPEDPDNKIRINGFFPRDKRYFGVSVTTYKGAANTSTKIAVWDRETNKVVKWINPPLFSWTEADYTPDGRLLYVIGTQPDTHNTYLLLYDTDKY